MAFSQSVLVFCTLIVPVVSVLVWPRLRALLWSSPLDNVPGPPSSCGTIQKLHARDGWQYHDLISTKFGKVVKVPDPWGTNQLFIYDPKALYHILVKDQHIYEQTSSFIQTRLLIFGAGLTATLGEHHKRQKKMLAPAFSINAMREMCPIFYSVGHKLRDAIQSRVKESPREIDMAGWMSRTSLQLIAESGLGISLDPLVDDHHVSDYAASVKAIPPAVYELEILRSHLPWIVKIGTAKFRRFLVDIAPWKKVRLLRDVVDEVTKRSTQILEAKKKAIEYGDATVAEQVGHGKDIMSILLRENMKAAEEDRLPESEVLGQISTFVVAATDTTSSALSRTLSLLSTHPEIQAKLRQEISDARRAVDGQDIPYNQLVNLQYLDAVCRETLRLYAPIAFQTRVARQDAILPLSNPIRGVDGTYMNEIHVPKDTAIMAGILASNRDPSIWGPDALEWKPERWLSPLPQAVKDAKIPGISSNLMTFSAGGRSCIGFKFAQLEMSCVGTAGGILPFFASKGEDLLEFQYDYIPKYRDRML